LPACLWQRLRLGRAARAPSLGDYGQHGRRGSRRGSNRVASENKGRLQGDDDQRGHIPDSLCAGRHIPGFFRRQRFQDFCTRSSDGGGGHGGDRGSEVGSGLGFRIDNRHLRGIATRVIELRTRLHGFDPGFHDWPIDSNDDGQRQIQAFIYNSLPGATGDSYLGSINGSPTGSHEVYIEGISIGRADIAGDSDEFEPSVDAISEFRLQTGGLNAAYGGGLTAVANFNIKSGTNEFHGTGYDYIENTVLNANGYDNNAFGNAKSPFKQNSFGGAVGGPLWIPKIYNGKNKSFLFFSYEGDRRRTGTISGFRSLPTAAFKDGDFSAIPQAIYDPNSTVSLGGGLYSRTPFPGNVIPASDISKVSENILKLAPVPNPTLPGFVRNALGSANQPIFNLDTFGGKFDQNISEKHKLSFFINDNDRFRYNGAGKGYFPVPGSASGSFALQNIHGDMIRISETWMIGPTLLNHFAFGYNRFNDSNSSATLGGDWPSKIG